MEYLIARALEISRITIYELGILQTREFLRQRCLMPYEIQELLKKTTLKDQFYIPEDDAIQQRYKARLKTELQANSFFPKYDLSPTDYIAIHEIDNALFEINEKMSINYECTDIKNRRKSLRDQL